MSGTEWDRIKEIFNTLRELDQDERAGKLDELCGDDPEVRREVLALLEAERENDGFLDSQQLDAEGGTPLRDLEAASQAAGEGPGDRIGPYKLLQQIGEGGFGVVYMAEQEKPIRRRVALKVIKPGMDTKQVIARFEAERQALAMLDHPNIAKVFDAGSTPAGRPYFVMELVSGIPITEYCDEQRLGTKERLELFAQVCGAVHHAHEQGIIHRDLKPSNVMVTLHDGTAVPKVIDFGVAKAIRQKLTEATLFTEYNQFIGTPEYMAPEQAAYAGLDVDRRSDVYSLGALLYELLTGTTPFEARKLRRAAHLEVLRILKEEEPPKPSTRVHTLGADSEVAARHRQVDVQGLAKLLRGDLDWIVMKALEKDRGRRYGSAADLATDIGRYFEQRPIEARPPSFGYRAQKLFRRRRGPFAAAAVMALLVVGDVAYVGWQKSRMAPAGMMFAASSPPVNELVVSSEDTGSCFFDGSPSPDGTKLLHTDWCRGDLYVRDLETGTMELVTEYDFNGGAAWLPDGHRISVAPGGPFDSPTIIDLESGARHVPAKLADLDLIPRDWSVDGEHLTGILMDEEGERWSVLMSEGTGERSVIKEGGDPGRFSPDGRYILFTDGKGTEDTDLWVLEVASGERWPLADGPDDEGNAFWSPDGRAVAYQTEVGLWMLPVTNGRPGRGRAQLVQRDGISPLGWSEAGFYYTVYNGVSRAYRVGVDPQTGRATGRRESIPLPPSSSDPVELRWSPDMQRIAVTRRYEETLHLMNGEATTSFSLAGHRPDKLWWSADGREVLFSNLSWGDAPTGSVFAVDVQSGHVREVFGEIEGVVRVHASSDGQRRVGARTSSDRTAFRDVVIAAHDQENLTVLAGRNEYGRPTGRADQPRFSPDGSWVLFARGMTDAASPSGYMSSVWIVRPDGSDERMLVEVPFLLSAEWDPSSRLVAYQASDGQGSSYLGVVSVDGRESHPVASFEDLEEWRLLDWSPDGEWLAVEETVGQWEFWVDRDLAGGSGESGRSEAQAGR